MYKNLSKIKFKSACPCRFVQSTDHVTKSAFFAALTGPYGLNHPSSINDDKDTRSKHFRQRRLKNKRVWQMFKEGKGIADERTAAQSKTNTIKCHRVSQSLDVVNKHSFKETH